MNNFPGLINIVVTNLSEEHFPSIATFPHHFHGNSGLVEASPLTGDPDHDLPTVLNLLSDLIKNIV